MYLFQSKNKTKNKTEKTNKTKKTEKTKKTKKTKNKTKNKTKKTKKLRIKPDNRKYTDTNYPYRNNTKKQATESFKKLKAAIDISAKSLTGNITVNYGTESLRVKTKYRGKSNLERWKNPKARNKMIQFAKKLQQYDIDNKNINPGPTISLQRAISMQWGTINTMRPAAALNIYKKYNATSVLDFTAGWGARMIAAAALDINYIGIDSNKKLEPGYKKIISAIKPYTKSNIKMIFKEAEKVDFSKLPKYDFVFTSPPYEYLEVYEGMTNYEGTEKIKQPSSAKLINKETAPEFYTKFMIPTLKSAYKYLPKGKFICLNIPDMMYEKIKKLWKKADKKELYVITKRIGSSVDKSGRRGSEYIYCWEKK